MNKRIPQQSPDLSLLSQEERYAGYHQPVVSSDPRWLESWAQTYDIVGRLVPKQRSKDTLNFSMDLQPDRLMEAPGSQACAEVVAFARDRLRALMLVSHKKGFYGLGQIAGMKRGLIPTTSAYFDMTQYRTDAAYPFAGAVTVSRDYPTNIAEDKDDAHLQSAGRIQGEVSTAGFTTGEYNLPAVKAELAGVRDNIRQLISRYLFMMLYSAESRQEVNAATDAFEWESVITACHEQNEVNLRDEVYQRRFTQFAQALLDAMIEQTWQKWHPKVQQNNIKVEILPIEAAVKEQADLILTPPAEGENTSTLWLAMADYHTGRRWTIDEIGEKLARAMAYYIELPFDGREITSWANTERFPNIEAGWSHIIRQLKWNVMENERVAVSYEDTEFQRDETSLPQEASYGLDGTCMKQAALEAAHRKAQGGFGMKFGHLTIDEVFQGDSADAEWVNVGRGIPEEMV
jgi:hypothetical protein